MNIKGWTARLAGLAGVALLLLLVAPVAAQDSAAGEQTYRAACAGCHQPDGRGIAGAFPPLADNPNALDAGYVADVIRNGKTGPIEVDGVVYDATMPALANLSDAEIADVIAFLATNTFTVPEVTEPVVPAGPGNADRGEALFLGSDRFENGGTACAACHTAGGRGNLGGQSMGPDLTGVVAKYGGEAGVTGVLQAPAFLVMQELFKDKPFTEQEKIDLAAFLARASTQSSKDSGDALFIIGLVGAAILFGGMVLIRPFAGAGYSRRLRRNA